MAVRYDFLDESGEVYVVSEKSCKFVRFDGFGRHIGIEKESEAEVIIAE